MSCNSAIHVANQTPVEVTTTTDTITLVGMPRNCGRDCNSVLTLWVDNSCTVDVVSAVVEKE